MFVIAIMALVMVAAVTYFGWSFRQFEEVTAQTRLRCTPVVGIHGALDFEPVPDSAAVYLSSMDRRGGASRGAIIRFDTVNPLDDSSWRDRTVGLPIDFQPGGLDIFSGVTAGGERVRRLFVVNGAGPEVLLYDIDPGGNLLLRRRFTDPRLTSPQDVIATGPSSFYVSNVTSGARLTWRSRLDFLLGLKTGQIFHYDGNSWSAPIGDLAFPSGLALSRDGTALYVAEMRAKRVRMFDRDPVTDRLMPSGDVRLEGFPDSVTVSGDGQLLVTAVPQPFSFAAYTKGIEEKAPSRLLRLSPQGEIDILFEDPGDILSAATAGVSLGDKTLIGSTGADRFLMCEGAPGADA
ncbi:SMP-30/gluconolactonase/LRE family protein [Parvularcula bermudensis]|nr:SMP-30/gluconolactonase/LRE family protein [Parvularcula bermudensis]